MFPGRTVATQYSGWPLPLPIRVSGGRAVTDLSGKIRIHSLPLRFMLRVNATRAASICVFVIQARSSVWSPNSPKSIRRLRDAVPLRLPRWVFRYFTRFGINGISVSPQKIVYAATGSGGGGNVAGWASAAGASSFLQIQHFTPILPYTV